jgi:putative transposase
LSARGFSEPTVYKWRFRLPTWSLQKGPSFENLKPVTKTATSPQSNGMAKSFVKTLKLDYAKLANRPDSKTLMDQQKYWFDDYNSYHPHSALGYLPPTLFRKKRSVT